MGIEKLASFWPEWQIDQMLGEGAYGKVYKAHREEHSLITDAAIKVITVPQSDAEVSSMQYEGMTLSETKTYFEGIVQDFVNEIKLMETLKGNSNIVSVEDFKVIEDTEKIGWDIFIRMELLEPFNKYAYNNPLSEDEVIKLGIDLCSALELCYANHIIHRDIKPENIFRTKFGVYKIGDFGIARELEKTSGSMSTKGTYNYMAPEVAHGQKYDATVDIYSLGIVMYRLLNKNRLPFTDLNAVQLTYQERKDATDKRLAGAPLTAPCDASSDMASIILKACCYDPAMRFRTPTEMKKALIACQNGIPVNLNTTATQPAVTDNLDATMAVKKPPKAPSGAVNTTVTTRQPVQSPVSPVANNVSNAKAEKPKKEKTVNGKKSKKKIIIIAACAIAVIALVTVLLIFKVFVPSSLYNTGISLMNQEKYHTAASVFKDKRCSNYKDSSSKLTECYYEIAKDYMEENNYEDAIEYFAKCDDYNDSEKLLKECRELAK